jgi:hypothetical protein
VDTNSINLETFKVDVEKFRGGRKRVMWPADIRARALELLAMGMTTTQIHNATAISFSALHFWQQKPKFKEIRISKPEVALTLRLSSKTVDVEIENLSTSAIVGILVGVL